MFETTAINSMLTERVAPPSTSRRISFTSGGAGLDSALPNPSARLKSHSQSGTGARCHHTVQLQIKHLHHLLLLTYVNSYVNMLSRFIESRRGGDMHDDAELRRAAEFLADLEQNLASPLTNTAPNPLSLSARNNEQSKNPQETHGAPPIEILRISNRELFESEQLPTR
jgi:hypothetical protein